MKHKITILNFILLLVLCLTFITPLFIPVQVLAAEEEEEDNFTTMPNYRWENQSETDPAVSEQLIGDNYIINNTNAGEGTQLFAKSRALNSRDFYFESRFALDVGGEFDQLEYWTDVEGNVSDFDDGSMESWAGIDNTDVNYCCDGWLYIWPWPSANGWLNITSTGNTIDASIYREFVGEFEIDFDAMENITDIYFYDSADNEILHWNTVIEKQELVYGEFDEDWSGTETELTICIKMSHTLLNYVMLNMTYLYNYINPPDWSETDGFKFSLLNADDEEGMAFQFTRNATDLSYNISIDMYDLAGAIALDYDFSFDYDIDVNGWLRIRVDWHLDKRNVKILFEYDNGTDIINIRRLTDLYGGNIGFTPLLLLEEGFPTFCINNSIGAIARSCVIINYIDADWNILEWREPTIGSEWTYTPAYTLTQSGINEDFSSHSPYGVSVWKKGIDKTTDQHYYTLVVDRFDGLSFDYNIQQAELDNGDFLSFYLGIYNIGIDGSLEGLFRVDIAINPDTVFRTIYSGTTELMYREEVNTESDGSLSIFRESAEKITLQYSFVDVDDNEYQGTTTVIPADESFTKEMLFVFGYEVETENQGFNTDTVEFSIGGFDLIRKDLIGMIVGGILGPLVGILTFIFSPFIILFQLLIVAFVKAFKELLVGLEPFFDILGDIFGTAIGALGIVFGTIIDGLADAFEGFIDGLEDALETVINGLWALLFGLAEDLGDFIILVIDWIIPLLAGIIDVIWNDLIMVVLMWIWDDFIAGSPLGFIIVLIVQAINAAPVVLMEIINVLLFWSFWILLAIWIVVLPMQAAQCEGISDFLERILGIFCINVLPIDIAGFGVWFPLAIPLIFFTCAEIIVLV